ncbi:MAG: hypothetical protein EXR99_08090 [Gemmataceae bacterium]|nr:hypothetical protein [Gemmataceae bacterium]
MEGKGVPPDTGLIPVASWKILVAGIAGILQDLADSLPLAFLLLASAKHFNGLPALQDTALHLALGFLFSGLVPLGRAQGKTLALAPAASFLTCVWILSAWATGFFLDPLFLGFTLGLGRKTGGTTLAALPTGNFGLGRKLDHWGSLARVAAFLAGGSLAWKLIPSSKDSIFDPLLYVALAPAIAGLASALFFLLAKSPTRDISPGDGCSFARPTRNLDYLPALGRGYLNGIFLAAWFTLFCGFPWLGTWNGDQLAGDFSWILLGALIGGLFSFLSSHPFRSLGGTPWAFLFSGLALVLQGHGFIPQQWALAAWTAFSLNGFFCARRSSRPEAPAMGSLWQFLFHVSPWLFAISLGFLLPAFRLTVSQIGWVLIASGILFALAFFRAFLEGFLAIFFQTLYRVNPQGPGLNFFPPRGPLLVVANHTAYLDPFWLGKAVSRPITPMMTSSFYDLPGISFLVRRVVRAIRVEDSTFRRTAPELEQAKEALKRGECLVIFPEGRLRRREEQILGSFGQGIWHILKELPDTPVVPVWIEGGWGSYTSRFHGPPMVNKSMDWFRKIDVVVGEPRILPPEILDDHRSTRIYLQKACLNYRSFLGLPATLSPEGLDSEGKEI